MGNRDIDFLQMRKEPREGGREKEWQGNEKRILW